MWTFAPSLVATTYAGWGELRSLTSGDRWDVRPEDLAIVRALAIGIPEGEAEQHRELVPAQKRGWAVQAPSTADAAVAGRLATLERSFAWCKAPEAARLAVLAAQTTRRCWQYGFAQRLALPETVARRAAYVGTPAQRVLVLGDDDFVSIALVALGHTVTVLESDAAIAELIRRSAPAGAALDVVEHDVREPLPARLVASFDAFVCDPISGPSALRLHLARGLAAVAPNGRGFICVGDASTQSFAAVTNEMSLDVDDRASDFNHYYGRDYALAAYVSDLVTVRSSEQTIVEPAATDPYLTKGVRIEDIFFESATTSYTFKNIDPDTCQLIHLDTVIQLLERVGRITVRNRSFEDNDGVRSYVVHTKGGSVIFIRILPEARVGELFVAPADTSLENALLTVLLGVLHVSGTVVDKRRVRQSTLYTMT